MRRAATAFALALALLPGVAAFAASPEDPAGEISIDSGRITGVAQVPPGPEYLRDAVFYQIYPQTFYDTNADGIGDLEGVIRKLDYVRSLGVDGFWINPFFASPFHDAGYDISDYYEVAPRYGTNDDARRMFAEAGKRGLKVLFDWVISYTSVDHPDVLALQEELKRVLRFWMDMGADGFRADMAGALVKTEHVTGNDQFFTTRGEGTKVFWNKIRALMDKEYPGSFMVAEWRP